MPVIESWDPGDATGVAIGYFDEKTAYELDEVVTLDQDGAFERLAGWAPEFEYYRVVESFELRGSNEFVASLVGKEIIGAMKYLQYTGEVDPIIWQDRQTKATVSDQILRRHGLWHTPGRVGHESARHVNDAIIHALAYLKAHHHRPTIEKYWGSHG